MNSNERYYKVICQEWEESERGWGCRPDGASLHVDMLECRRFADEYWESEKRSNTSGAVPDCYTRECGRPKVVEVTAEIYEEIIKNGTKTVMFHERLYRSAIETNKIRMVA